MATQVLELTGLGGEGWSGAAPIDPALIEGGGTAYLRFIRRIGNNFQVRLSATATADPENVGPEFTEAFETADSAFTFAAGGSTLVLKGPGNADNSFADASEPYFWTPDNGAAMSSWFASTVGDFTLTLSDGLPDVAVHAVQGAAAAGGAETRARIDVVPALALSDFDGRGLEFDVLALIRAGSGSGGTIYASPPRGAVGALLDGELGLGADEAAITRIRRRNGTMLAINDNDPLSLASYFSPGGAGADLTLYIQTHDGAASFPASDHGREGGNMIQFGPLAAGLLSLIDDIADGERFIFALARPARTVVETRGVAEAGAPQVRARVLRVTPAIRMVRGTAAAGAPHAAAYVRALPVRTLHGTAAAGGRKPVSGSTSPTSARSGASPPPAGRRSPPGSSGCARPISATGARCARPRPPTACSPRLRSAIPPSPSRCGSSTTRKAARSRATIMSRSASTPGSPTISPARRRRPSLPSTT